MQPKLDDRLMREIRLLIVGSQSERVLANRIYELVTRERNTAANDARMQALGVGDLSFPDEPIVGDVEYGGEG